MSEDVDVSSSIKTETRNIRTETVEIVVAELSTNDPGAPNLHRPDGDPSAE